MSCVYLTKIVSSLPDVAQPKVMYLVENGDGTFTMYVSDSQGNLNKSRDAKGIGSVQAGDHVTIDNTNPDNPVINVVLPEVKELEFVGNGLTIDKRDNVVTVTNTPTIEGVNAGDNIEIDRTIPTQPVIKSIIPEVLKSITEDKIRSWDAKPDTDTQYDDAPLIARVAALENKPDKDTLYDDGPITARVEALEGKVDNDTIYNDSELRGRIEALETKPDNDTLYDDTELREKITALEGRVDNDTIYNDTELRNRIETLENKQDNDTIYNDAELRGGIEVLETKPDKDTVYDDTEVRGILNTKVSLNDLQDNLVIKSQEVLDNNLKVVLTYTNAKGQSKDLEISQPLPQYQLPDHLANLTPEQIGKLLKLIENIGVWDDEQPRVFNDNFTNEFA